MLDKYTLFEEKIKKKKLVMSKYQSKYVYK